MSYSVPTTGDATDAGKDLAVQGVPLGVGESLGRSLLGPGLGTALGGVAVASMNEGMDGQVQATIAGERAMNEIMSGMGASSNSGGRGSI
jgi:hypothetical protein